MPTRLLPPKPSLAHLRNQAKDLLRAQRDRDPRALQRLREFHPRMQGLSDERIAAHRLTLNEAYLAIAREYGFASWQRLKHFVASGAAPSLELPAHERIDNPAFRRAVDFIDAGDVDRLRAHLAANPHLTRERVAFEGGNYFRTPALIEFVAENPTRRGTLPPNIAEVARVLLSAGAASDAAAINSALELVASSRVARESGAQSALIEVLCEYGADPNAGIPAALLYGEFESVRQLIGLGAKMTLTAAAALGITDQVRALLPSSVDADRKLALALAAQHRRADAARALLAAGVDPNGFTPNGHSHATPLHQAALTGDDAIVTMLLEHGARADVLDVLYDGTPAGWAAHAGHPDLAARLHRAAMAERAGPDASRGSSADE